MAGKSTPKKVDRKDQYEQMRQDAAVVSRPDSLRCILAALDGMGSMRFGRADFQESIPNEAKATLENMTGVPTQQMWKEAKDNIRSAHMKLQAFLECTQKPDVRALMMSRLEARSVCGILWLFKESVHARMKAPPEHARGKREMDRILGCAVRFFSQLAKMTDDEVKDVQA